MGRPPKVIAKNLKWDNFDDILQEIPNRFWYILGKRHYGHGIESVC